jgi:ATP-dependent Zn protease
MGPERRSAVIEDKVKLATSYHEVCGLRVGDPLI